MNRRATGANAAERGRVGGGLRRTHLTPEAAGPSRLAGKQFGRHQPRPLLVILLASDIDLRVESRMLRDKRCDHGEP